MATRDSLLDVTARLYAEHGWRGTTTRRIAEAAGVNEVTIFRQFGSKEALLLAAIETASRDGSPPLPAVPGDLRGELAAWAQSHHRLVSAKRGLIRASLAEGEARPELAPVACQSAMSAFDELRRYLGAARAKGMLGASGSLEAACLMLLNAIFLDAMTRGVMPAEHGPSVEQLLPAFVDLTLRSLGGGEGA